MTEQLKNLVSELKKALEKDETICKYLSCQDAYMHDESLLSKTNEYNVQRSVYETESQKEDRDEQLLESIQARLDVIYKEITESETANRLVAAEDAANNLYTEIFRELQSVVVHEHEHNCSGHCDSCGGCH